MDAHALLSAQGWRGIGHSLHAKDDSIGLAKPLLLARKDNTHGLGNKKHFTSDQWWLDAFDEQVKGLDTSKEGTVVQTVTTGRLNAIGKGVGRYALYASFVKGGLLEGSISKAESTYSSPVHSPEEPPQTTTETANPRETKEERRARREAKRLHKAEKLAQKIQKTEIKPASGRGTPSDSKETLEEQRARKVARRRKREMTKLQDKVQP